MAKSTSGNKVEVSVSVLGLENANKSKGSSNYFQGLPLDPVETEEMLNPGTIISRLDHSVTLSYEGAGMMLPPRGRLVIANLAKLGAIPKGIFVVPGKQS